ncbi:hypothetical protein BC831DRAFT_448847 [Entophlyctis helioformis]|nr:hypothetical protein BC831DRAFT_448847 [Entophlyctis helioformis]
MLSVPQRTSGNSLCVVNASCAYLDGKIYSFGGFHFVSDVVYNDLHILNLADNSWRQVHHIRGVWPCKRTDHTMTPWGSDHLVVFGGSDTNEAFLNDVHVLDLRRMAWESLECAGDIPIGRAKHSAVIHNDKLYISGGRFRKDEDIVDEINILDLSSLVWEPPIHFVRRHAHNSWIYNNRLYIYGGFDENMDRGKSLSFYDLESASCTVISIDSPDAPCHMEQQHVEAFGKDLIVVSVPVHWRGFEDPAQIQHSGLWALDLDTLSWRRLSDGRPLQSHVWHYHIASSTHPRVYLLGEDPDGDDEEGFMSNILTIDLELFGIHPTTIAASSLATDLGSLLIRLPHLTDFHIASSLVPDAPPIPVHRLILVARWPFFANMVASGMSEASSGTLSLAESPAALCAFIAFLYTDTLSDDTPDIHADVMLMAHRYCLDRLQRMCSARLLQDLSAEYALRVFLAAAKAREYLLRDRSLAFLLAHFGAIIKSSEFRSLSAAEMGDLWDALPEQSRIMTGDAGIDDFELLATHSNSNGALLRRSNGASSSALGFHGSTTGAGQMSNVGTFTSAAAAALAAAIAAGRRLELPAGAAGHADRGGHVRVEGSMAGGAMAAVHAGFIGRRGSAGSARSAGGSDLRTTMTRSRSRHSVAVASAAASAAPASAAASVAASVSAAASGPTISPRHLQGSPRRLPIPGSSVGDGSIANNNRPPAGSAMDALAG